MTRHFLDLSEFDGEALKSILAEASSRKEARKGQSNGTADADAPLSGKLLAMIFEKPSTRTRASFDVAMRQLGGETMIFNSNELQLGRGETIADTARVLSRYVDGIMIRTDAHSKLHELAEAATVPVINGLTDYSHPCQLMADVMTFEEHKGAISGAELAWLGDANNNVAASLVHAAGKFGFSVRFGAPEDFMPAQDVLTWAEEEGVSIVRTSDPDAAAKDADCIMTDTWVSMGDEDAGTRHNILAPYRVTGDLMSKAQKNAVFMHCLPAHRGDEVTAEVIDGPQSIVFDQAENRLHAQKGY